MPGGRGGSADLRGLGLPVRWLAWPGYWLRELVAAHYREALDDFIVADNMELPWPRALAGYSWEWRVVSLRDIFPEELVALCVSGRGRGPQEDLGSWPDGERGAGSWANRE